MSLHPIVDFEKFNELVKYILNTQTFIDNKELLCIALNEYHWTIAHEQASRGWTTNDPEILKLSTTTGLTVAHIQAYKGWTTDNFEILKLIDPGGRPVALLQVYKGWITNDPQILKLANGWGWTVAHEQASRGWTTDNPEILKLADKKGWTVAHEQAKRGWITNDKEILKLTDNHGTTVYSLIIDYWNKKDLGEINENFDKLFSFILELEKLGLKSIKETQLYENVMYLVRLLSKILKRINSRQKKNNINKN